MVSTRMGLVARGLAILALLIANAVIGVRADGDCDSCLVIGGSGLCFPVAQGNGNFDCKPNGDHCDFGDRCVVE